MIFKHVDATVALGVIIHGVDNDLPGERLGWKFVILIKGDRYHHDITGLCSSSTVAARA